MSRLPWVGVGLLWASCLGYHGALCWFPYQLEPTEGGLLQSAIALRAGQDPWSTALAPIYFNTYGIGYPALAARISAWLPRLDLLLVLRLLSAVSAWLGLAGVYAFLQRGGAGRLVGAAACGALYSVMLYFDTLAAKPDGLAMALGLLAVASTLSPGRAAWALPGVLAAAGFFVKPTALLAVPLAALHLWLLGRRRDALLSLAAAAAAGAVLLALVLRGHPHYLDGTFFLHAAASTYSLPWMGEQILTLLGAHFPLAAASLAALGLALRRSLPWAPQGAARRAAWLALAVAGVLAAGPGAHWGAFLRYYNQLLLPWVLVAVPLWLLQQGWSRPWLALLLVLDGATALSMNLKAIDAFTPEQRQTWAKAEAWVQAHPKGIYPPLFTSLALRHGAFITDTEHTHWLHLARHGSAPSPLAEAGRRFTQRVDQALAEGYFDTVVCGANWPCPPRLQDFGWGELAKLGLRTPLGGPIWFSIYVPLKPKGRGGRR